MAGALTVGAPALLLGPISHSGAVCLLGGQTEEDRGSCEEDQFCG